MILDSYTGIITPSDSHILHHSKDDRFSVRTRKKMDESDLDKLCSYEFVNCPYAVVGMPLQYLLFQKPGFADTYSIDNIDVAEEDGVRIATISVSSENTRGAGTMVFRFLPDHAWVLHEVIFDSMLDSEKETGDHDYSRIRCVYREGECEIPQLAEMVREGGLKKKDGVIRLFTRDKYTVESFAVGPAEMSIFDVGSLVDNRSGGEMGALPYLLIVCVVFGVLLLVVRIYLRRRRRIATAGGIGVNS